MATDFYETKSLLTVVCRRSLASPKLATYLAGDPRADPTSPLTQLSSGHIAGKHLFEPYFGAGGPHWCPCLITDYSPWSSSISHHIKTFACRIQGTQMMKLSLVFIESSDAREYNYTPPLNHMEVKSANLPPSWKSVYNFSLPPNLAAHNLLLTLPMT